jgi:hypothetical protein
MDRGPWTHLHDRTGSVIASDDFRHDVVLQVSGDFADEAERLAYCDWLAKTLNEAGEVPNG